MISYRQMSAGELSKIADIDRAEVVHGAFEHLEGQLVLTRVTWDIPGFFKEGEGEHTVAEQIAFCRRHLAAKGILVGAFAGEELVGIGLVTPEIRPGMAQLAYLQVSAPYRRRGIATVITQRLLGLARAQGATNVYVSATPSQPTVAFYQKFGFSPAAEPLPELYELEPEDIHMTLDLFSSPRMASLHRDLEKGRSAALDTFWSEVRQQGTPLVEHIPDDDEHVLVTFLWQGALDTSNVVVRNDDFRWTNIAGASGVRENAMTNLSGSDVWYKTYRLRSDYCVDYLLSPNDPELLGLESDDGFARKTGSSEESWRETTATWQLDPLNPQQIRIAYDEEDHPEREESLARSTWMKSLNSYIELPGFDPNPWFKERQGVPKGRVEKHRFSSTILNNTRAVFTYTPPGDTARRTLCITCAVRRLVISPGNPNPGYSGQSSCRGAHSADGRRDD